MSHRPTTLGDLKNSGWKSRSVKQEMRENLIAHIRSGEKFFRGIIGYDDTVVPQIEHAVLSLHDFLLLGLRGQAKTRMIRQLVNLLDEWMPALAGTPLRDDPYNPITRRGRHLIADLGDDAPIEWVPRTDRYQEKLATPDVTIADLIGDIDPIKAMSKKLEFSDEEVINYGIIPRSNRGIFAINEVPDLQPRIQVGLLNIMEEKDVQIRGFPVRIPLDLAIVYTANPEDYTNRGNLITPLKDRIDAQILTHYPHEIEEAARITRQEAWTERPGGGAMIEQPALVIELIERTAVAARESEYVDRNSGVSARMGISLLETLVSTGERRCLATGETTTALRVVDLFESIPALTGKIELVYKGEQEGIVSVAFAVLGAAIRDAFNRRFLPGYRPGREKRFDFPQFKRMIDWFEEGNSVDITTSMSDADYRRELSKVAGLKEVVAKHWPDPKPASEVERALAMEFVLEGLHQNFLLTKQRVGRRSVYTDTVSDVIADLEV
jgi:magnesium chelatase subunit I